MIIGEVVGARVAGAAAVPAHFRCGASLWLPDRLGRCGQAGLASKSPANSDGALARQRSVQVLLIEDDAAIAEMYRVQLEYDGYQVTVATTGQRGFATMATYRPDIVLLDLLLPDRSGLEIMGDIKERFPDHPPVVILSNYGEPAMIDRGFSLGAVEYLVKSRVTPAVVSSAIPGWIEQAGRGPAEPRN
jgi:CheY-like chemotaxis protein